MYLKWQQTTFPPLPGVIVGSLLKRHLDDFNLVRVANNNSTKHEFIQSLSLLCNTNMSSINLSFLDDCGPADRHNCMVIRGNVRTWFNYSISMCNQLLIPLIYLLCLSTVQVNYSYSYMYV